jgi:hypothetical protein
MERDIMLTQIKIASAAMLAVSLASAAAAAPKAHHMPNMQRAAEAHGSVVSPYQPGDAAIRIQDRDYRESLGFPFDRG